MKDQNLLPPETIAAMLNINRKTITALARKGVLPSVRIGKSYRFSLQEVIAHLEIETVPEVVEFIDRNLRDEGAAS